MKKIWGDVKQNGPQNRLINMKRNTGRTPAARSVKSMCERSLLMEKTAATENLWRVWVDTTRRIVSFHEEEGCKLLEFRSREMFLSCVDQYTGMQYRYQ